MREVFEEFLLVLQFSWRTQLWIYLGIIFFLGVLLGGEYFSNNFVLHGFLAPMSDVIREKILYRYDNAAWVLLGSSWLTAIKQFRKDRKRILGM
ncbi:hypothetical protein [Acidithiobacillus sp. HP-11]|uniref:hypothetical protein n=1 Tax=Acidithiobacillus sp. HP-11 TaxID=2697656 RepID=UPI00187AD194|nr:hypothetical protein [Acidithiobacillus sp. HP-11]MBE7566644.1 hypothetical protein [Acidithiobacillus sp. HP-11]